MSLHLLKFVAICVSFFIAFVPTQAMSQENHPRISYTLPMGKVAKVKQVSQQANLKTTLPQNGIFFRGGPVLGATSSTIPNVYLIWYGNWNGNSALQFVPTFLRGFGATSNYNINTTYTDATGAFIRRQVNYPVRNDVFDNYSQGNTINGYAGVQAVVLRAINTGSLPLDANGIYFVITSTDVIVPSYCGFCSWHSYTSLNGVVLPIAFIPNPQNCGTCLPQTISPNKNAGGDAIVNFIAHHINEIVTDPQLNAWADNASLENSAKCNWQFGATQTDCTGAKFNMTVNGLNFLVKQNWVNLNGGYCANSV